MKAERREKVVNLLKAKHTFLLLDISSATCVSSEQKSITVQISSSFLSSCAKPEMFLSEKMDRIVGEES